MGEAQERLLEPDFKRADKVRASGERRWRGGMVGRPGHNRGGTVGRTGHNRVAWSRDQATTEGRETRTQQRNPLARWADDGN